MPEFRVDDETGTDQERLDKANKKAGLVLGTILLPDREIVVTRSVNLKSGVSVRGEGSDSAIFLDRPGASAPTGSAPYALAVLGKYGGVVAADLGGSVLEGFSVRARPEGYYTLLRCQDARAVTFRNLTFGVCGQNFIEVRGCSQVYIEDSVGRYGGDNSYDGAPAKYKISLIKSQDVHLTGLVMGDPTHDRNQSFVTFNNVVRGSVRDSRFYGTRTYALNTHGTGSKEIVFEGNALTARLATKYGSILIGNESWGADRDITIRGNLMEGTGRFCEVRMASLVIFGHNSAPDCTEFLRVVHPDAVVVMGP